jgi:hypothetical protein
MDIMVLYVSVDGKSFTTLVGFVLVSELLEWIFRCGAGGWRGELCV